MGWFRYRKKQKFMEQASKTEGKVVEIIKERDENNNEIYNIVYEYMDISGVKWSNKTSVPMSTAKRAKGRSVEVYYQTEKPDEGIIGEIYLESKIACPTCGCQEVTGAYIEDGGWGDWCPKCKKSINAMEIPLERKRIEDLIKASKIMVFSVNGSPEFPQLCTACAHENPEEYKEVYLYAKSASRSFRELVAQEAEMAGLAIGGIAGAIIGKKLGNNFLGKVRPISFKIPICNKCISQGLLKSGNLLTVDLLTDWIVLFINNEFVAQLMFSLNQERMYSLLDLKLSQEELSQLSTLKKAEEMSR
jgi:hypothetical protein